MLFHALLSSEKIEFAGIISSACAPEGIIRGDMRRFSAWIATAALALASPLAAQEWPAKPIRVVVPYAAGSVADVLFRAMAPTLEARLGQRFVLDNKAGAAGNIGTAEAIRAAPDGYTLLLAPTANFAVNQHLFRDLGFDPLAALEPISMIAEAPLIAVVSESSITKLSSPSLKGLLEYARAHPGQLNYGSPGSGSPAHLTGALFSQLAGGALVYVPYKGSPPMVQALMADDIQLAFPTITTVLGALKTGKVRVLAVMARERLPELPDVPTTIEAGYPDLASGNWWVIAAPRGTDARIVDRLAAEVRSALADPAIRKRIVELGHVAAGLAPADTQKFLRAESARYKAIVEAGGIRPEL
jgi:tripartite-type tricarboxylate transporter receptor subunit TctC